MQTIKNASPHIRGPLRTQHIMCDVLIALLPALAAGVWIFGLRALLVTITCAVSAVAGEWLWRVLTRQHQTVMDGSAAVTGILLALTLPASVPYHVAAMGSLFAVIAVKGLCGGLGQNVFNPALAARAFLMLICPVYITRFLEAGAKLSLGVPADAVAAATPLHEMQMLVLPEVHLKDMFLGNIGGCIGEVSALALLIGGLYLVIRKVISPRIPLAYLGSVALLSLVFAHGDAPLMWMLYSLCGGGIMLGAIFMATDYTTSPVTPKGQIIYGIGAGVLTVLFRYKGLFPEGVTYAILLMNGAVWMIEQLTAPRRFGVKKGAA